MEPEARGSLASARSRSQTSTAVEAFGIARSSAPGGARAVVCTGAVVERHPWTRTTLPCSDSRAAARSSSDSRPGSRTTSSRTISYRHAPGRSVTASESRATYDLSGVEQAVEAAAALDVGELSDDGLEELLGRLRRPIAQLVALRSRASAASQARRVKTQRSGQLGGELRDHQRQLADQQGQTPADTKREIDAGRAAERNAATGDAFTDGAIGPEHARQIDRILRDLPPDRQGAVEAELLPLAMTLDPVAFGRRSRAILAREIPEAAVKDERIRHGQRRLRAADTADGGFAFSGLLYGAAAEHARVAFDAFRRPDTPGEHRSPEQRSADAFEQLCAAALRVGEAPTNHGVRPHVIVVIDADQLAAYQAGDLTATARFAGSAQPVSGREFGPLLADCHLSRVVLDAAGAPIEVSTSTRHVPIGLWRGLLVRDGGCVWDGCDAPASWCDVAHGHTAYAADGRLSLDNAALLCRRHHRQFDGTSHRFEVHGGDVIIRATSGEGGSGAPAAGRSPAGATRGRDPDRNRGPDRERGPDGSLHPDRNPGHGHGSPDVDSDAAARSGGDAGDRTRDPDAVVPGREPRSVGGEQASLFAGPAKLPGPASRLRRPPS